MAIGKPFFVVPLDLGTVTTGNERASRPAIHLKELKDVGMVWQSSGNGTLWIRGNLGSAKAIDFVSLMATNAQPGTTIRVRIGDTQGEVDGTADYDSGVVTLIDPAMTSIDGYYHSHLEIPSVLTKQWWRIDIASHTGDFEASTLVIGQKKQLNRFYDREFGFGGEDKGSLDYGQYGVITEEDGIILRQLAFKMSWITEAEYETLIRPIMETMGVRGFMYWCFDPLAGVYRQNRTYLGAMAKSLNVTASPKPQTFIQEFTITSPY